MPSDDMVGQATAAFAIVTGLSYIYGKLIGPRQTAIVQMLVDLFELPSRVRPAVNFAVGLILAFIVSVFLSIYFDDWMWLALGVLAMLFSSDEAAKEHDTKNLTSGAFLPLIESDDEGNVAMVAKTSTGEPAAVKVPEPTTS